MSSILQSFDFSALEAKEIRQLERILETFTQALFAVDPSREQIVIPAGAAKSGQAKEQARYQALVEQIPALTFTVSLEEGAPEIYVGPQIEQILGYTQQEWMEDPILWFKRCHPEDRDIWHQTFSAGIASGGPFRADCRVLAKDDSIVWLHGQARLVRDDAGRPLFLQGIAFDITEQKKAEQRMREAQDVKVMNERLNAVGQMAASIGHDLRNPLGAIRNAWFVIDQKVREGEGPLKDDARYNRMAAIIEREIKTCTTILAELLEFARDREPHKVLCPLAPLVDEVFSVVTRPAATMRLVNDVPEDMRAPYVDLTQFRQAVVNLVQNALEAIAPDGLVRVVARHVEADDAVVVEVIDDGKGIAPELRESIWKPLFTTKAKGTGLGLPIVFNVVQRHSGLVWMESAPGRGATFRIQVPVSTPSAPDDRAEVRFFREREIERAPTMLRDLVDEALASAGKPPRGVRLVNGVPSELPHLHVDRDVLRQAIASLVQNGVDAVEAEGTVAVGAARDGSSVVISVRDDGRGVAPDLGERIWEPLFTTKPNGTGLGLPLARNALALHGGTIDVESAPGAGTTFRLRLAIDPVADEAG